MSLSHEQADAIAAEVSDHLNGLVQLVSELGPSDITATALMSLRVAAHCVSDAIGSSVDEGNADAVVDT